MSSPPDDQARDLHESIAREAAIAEAINRLRIPKNPEVQAANAERAKRLRRQIAANYRKIEGLSSRATKNPVGGGR